MGYGNEEYGYRLWDPVNKKIVRNRDVVFFKDQNIEDTQKTENPKKPREYPVNSDKDSQRTKQDGRRETGDSGDATNDPMVNDLVGDTTDDEEEAPPTEIN